MFDIIASVAAKGDLEEIKTYLLKEFRNPQAVANLEAAIRRAYDTLAENLIKIHRFFHGLQNWALYL